MLNRGHELWHQSKHLNKNKGNPSKLIIHLSIKFEFPPRWVIPSRKLYRSKCKALLRDYSQLQWSMRPHERFIFWGEGWHWGGSFKCWQCVLLPWHLTVLVLYPEPTHSTVFAVLWVVVPVVLKSKWSMGYHMRYVFHTHSTDHLHKLWSRATERSHAPPQKWMLGMWYHDFLVGVGSIGWLQIKETNTY